MSEEHPTLNHMFAWMMLYFTKGEEEADELYPRVKAHFACFRSDCRDYAHRALALTETHKNHKTVAESYEERLTELRNRYWL